MTTETLAHPKRAAKELDYVTFYLGDLLLGIDIHAIQEINRQLEVTIVPHAPSDVRGTVNLRGEVVTVVDLRTILGLEPATITAHSRNVIVNSAGEQIGLLVDRIADAVKAHTDDMEPPPINLSGIDGRFFSGVYKIESDLLVILDVNEALAVDNGKI